MSGGRIVLERRAEGGSTQKTTSPPFADRP